MGHGESGFRVSRCCQHRGERERDRERSVPGWDGARRREGPVWELSVGERQGEAGLPGRLPPQALGLCARTCAVPLVWSPPPRVFLCTSSSSPSPTPVSSRSISPPSLPSTPSHLPLPLLSHQFLPLSSSASLFHPPSPNSASLCVSDLSSLPSLSFLLRGGGCDHRNISEEEEGAELGRG